MNTNKKCLPILTFLLMPVMTNAGVVTYEFTGIVTASSFSPVPPGERVSGVLTFDFGNATQTTGDVGSSQIWTVEALDNPNSSISNNYVFTSTVNCVCGGNAETLYSTQVPFTPDPPSSIVSGAGGIVFSAVESNAARDSLSSLNITSLNGLAVYGSGGVPLLRTLANESVVGQFESGASIVTYEVLTLTARVPPPSPHTP